MFNLRYLPIQTSAESRYGRCTPDIQNYSTRSLEHVQVQVVQTTSSVLRGQLSLSNCIFARIDSKVSLASQNQNAI